MKKLEVFEIFAKVEEAKTKKEKLSILREYDIMPVRDVLQGTFDPNITWNLPEGEPPFNAQRPESTPSSLRKQHLKFKYFVKGLLESDRLTKMKREGMFISMLEAVHPEDARILVSMINKKTPVKGLTKKLVEEAYPDLIPKT